MKVVESMLNKVDEALLARVKKEKLRIFNKELEEGKRLSYFEIKELNTMLKGDYVKFIKKEDQIASHYIEAQQERNEEIHDEQLNTFTVWRISKGDGLTQLTESMIDLLRGLWRSALLGRTTRNLTSKNFISKICIKTIKVRFASSAESNSNVTNTSWSAKRIHSRRRNLTRCMFDCKISKGTRMII